MFLPVLAHNLCFIPASNKNYNQNKLADSWRVVLKTLSISEQGPKMRFYVHFVFNTCLEQGKYLHSCVCLPSETSYKWAETKVILSIQHWTWHYLAPWHAAHLTTGAEGPICCSSTYVWPMSARTPTDHDLNAAFSMMTATSWLHKQWLKSQPVNTILLTTRAIFLTIKQKCLNSHFPNRCVLCDTWNTWPSIHDLPPISRDWSRLPW